jgi:FMN phosphatase YigB (HAD superfamily)
LGEEYSLSFSFFKSFITSSRHHFFGRPLVLIPIGFQLVLLTNCNSSILFRCLRHSFFFSVFNSIFSFYQVLQFITLILQPSLD